MKAFECSCVDFGAPREQCWLASIREGFEKISNETFGFPPRLSDGPVRGVRSVCERARCARERFFFERWSVTSSQSLRGQNSSAPAQTRAGMHLRARQNRASARERFLFERSSAASSASLRGPTFSARAQTRAEAKLQARQQRARARGARASENFSICSPGPRHLRPSHPRV